MFCYSWEPWLVLILSCKPLLIPFFYLNAGFFFLIIIYEKFLEIVMLSFSITDWFDGLNTFMRYICHKSWLGGWFMPQKKSYFALQLPKRWWVFGLDLALHGDIDVYQFKFFSELVKSKVLSSLVLFVLILYVLNFYLGLSMELCSKLLPFKH